MVTAGAGERRRGLASALWRLADLVQAHEGRRSFRAKAYRKVVWSLDELSVDLSDDAETMLRVKGVGPGVIRLIDEYRSTGRLEQLDLLTEAYPMRAGRLRRLPRMTPSILRQLKGDLGVDTESDLLAAIEGGHVDLIKGVGPATTERWWLTLGSSRWDGALPSFHASVLADDVARHLGRHLETEVRIAGSVRRVEEWVEQLDLVVATDEADSAMGFLRDTAIARSSARIGTDHARLQLHEGLPAEVHITRPSELGMAMVLASGPAEHAETLLAEWKGTASDETEIYRDCGLPWIPPSARDLPIEIAAGVVRVADLRGDLHLHTDWSPDGRMSLGELCHRTESMGYEYILVTDHAVGLHFGGLDARALALQREAIEGARLAFPGLRILHGAELNIDLQGNLDLDDRALDSLDCAVAAVHSGFDLDRPAQTARLLRAMQHPKVRVLGHLTGRRIGIRPPMVLDFDSIVAGAIANGVALEVNGHRDRLDLSTTLARRAVKAGAVVAANSDAHRTSEIENVGNAVAILQAAGVSPESVVNSWGRQRFLRWLAGETRPAATETTGANLA